MFCVSREGEITEYIPYFGLPLSSDEYVKRSERARSMMDRYDAAAQAIVSLWTNEPRIQLGSDRPYDDEVDSIVAPLELVDQTSPEEQVEIDQPLGSIALDRELVLELASA